MQLIEEKQTDYDFKKQQTNSQNRLVQHLQLMHSDPSFCTIVSAILVKNYYIVRQNILKFMLIYFSPLIVLLLLVLLQSWANTTLIWQQANPPIVQIPPISKCYGQDCLTLAYIVEGQENQWVQKTMDYVKKSNNFTDKDVQRWKMNPKQVLNKLEVVPNKTQAVVIFCTTGSWQIESFEMPCYGESHHLNTYTILFNLTLFHRVPFFSNLKSSYPKDLSTIRLKRDLDVGIINYYAGEDNHFNLTVTDFPSKNSRFITGMSIFAQYGSFFIMIPYLILMVMEGSHKLKQKQDRLRIGLNIVGVSHFQFYFAQLLTYLVNVLIISVNFCLWGYVLKFKFWTNALIWFDFIVLTVNGFTLGIIAFCITAAVSYKNLGMSVIYGFVLYSIIMQWIFSGGYILELLYMDTATFIVKFFKYLFNSYPSFHFTKIFADISRTADNHFDTLVNKYVDGRPFTTHDLFMRRSQTFQKPFPRSYTFPNCMQSLLFMLLTTIFSILILFLLDRYVESNRGYSQPLFSSKKRKLSEYANNIEMEERESIVKIFNLQKIYSNNVHALRGVSQQLYKGEIASLLGENGAGKSTLINILIGALSPSKGGITVEGSDVRENLLEIRKICGVCPQFDILWNQLTASQHIQMFSKIKGFPYDAQTVKNILESVQLYEFRDGITRTFSGGMKRRLSLAISLIGNPKLIVLDEPTTGMDVKIRLQTWKIILQLRSPHRTMLITTHSMEEAECLSDRILIMSKGKVSAKGTAVQLKKQFGQGYRIEGNTKGSETKIVLKCSEDKLEQNLSKMREMQLQNWSLEQTTLEQVFLNVVNHF